MHVLIGIAIIAGGIWLAIEYPQFRKALAILGIGLLLFCLWAAWFLTSKPS